MRAAEPRRSAEPETEVRENTRLAPRYRVLVHNDDVTPMEVVVAVLLSVFHLGFESAEQVMLEAHRTGIALVAVLPLEEAEVRCDMAHTRARGLGYPLTFTYEPER
jgi:ATP-dependent Clp protease adaptor protein ClpS